MLSAKINTSASFRSLSKVLVTFNLYLNIELSSPSFSTAMLWIKKIGYIQLQSAKEKADDWIIILDERKKFLLFWGLGEAMLTFPVP